MNLPKRKLLAVLLLIPLVMQLTAHSATAQAALRVQILSLDIDDFPTVSLSVSVTDQAGAFKSDLPTTSFQVLENENPLPGLVMREERVGTQQVFVINSFSGLNLRIPSGESYFDLIRDALMDWWSRRDASEFGLDDLTLITNSETLVAHSSSAARIASELDRFEPIFSPEANSPALLVEALSIATDAPPRPGMPRHLIFITPYIYSMVDLPLANVIARAVEAQTSIHVVFAAPAPALDFVGTEGLRQLAQETGGIFLHFDPEIGLTSITDQVLTQRELYELTYTSHTSVSGIHSVTVHVTDGNLLGVSESRSYAIDIEPPELAFIQPPSLISREPTDPDNPIETLAPNSQTMDLLITFPDGHPRAVTSTWLVVDGEVMDQRTQSPFDSFTWDLSQYMEGGTHSVKAVAQDILGLEGSSPESQIFVDVPPPPSGLSALRPALGSLLAALAVLVAGVVLAVTLLNLGQRSQPARVRIEEPAQRSRIRLERASLQPPDASQPAEAFLAPLEHSDGEATNLPLTGAELTLGRDASLAAVTIDDPSVSAIHARLIRRAGGSYFLRDQGSVAGTWVNYEAVSEEGRELQHGDLIHLGRVGFRFQLKNPPPARQVRIKPDAQE
jgi:pSer/pThr/pTyr-binding forkhead associated (FHA) protein